MANPLITPASYSAAGTFTVTQSTVAYFDLYVAALDSSPPEITIDCPVAATVLVSRVALTGGGWSGSGDTLKAASTAWSTTTVVFGGSADQWSAQVSGIVGTSATIAMANVSGPTVGLFRILITGLAAADTCSVSNLDGNSELGRVLAGPRIYGLAASLTAYEGDLVSLTGNADHSILQWITAPAGAQLSSKPLLRGRWPTTVSTVGNPTFNATDASAASGPIVPALAFTAPPIYGSTALSFTIEAWYDFNNDSAISAGEPSNSSTVPVTVEQNTHHMVVVLDRSGSMAGTLGGKSKWEETKLAARLWADLFGAFRTTTASAVHKMGFLTFEHGTCSWGVAAGATDITLRSPGSGAALSAPLAELSGLTTAEFNLGSPGSCTPIGDALVAAIEALHATPAPTHVRYTVLLMTDGYANSGIVTIKANTAGGGSKTWTSWRNDHLAMADYAAILNNMNLYTLGVGASVEVDLLSQLPSTVNNVNGLDFSVASESASELLPEFALMLSDALGVEEVATSTLPLNTDLEPAADKLEAKYFHLNAGEQKLVIVVGRTAVLTEGLRIRRRPQSGGDWFQVIPGSGGVAALVTRPTYFLVIVDLATELGSSPSPSSEWKVQLRGSNGTGTAVAIPNLLVLDDLYLATDFSFDRHLYRTGDPMQIQCRVFAGNTPITGATVRVETAAPDVGLGTFLSEGGAAILRRSGDDKGERPPFAFPTSDNFGDSYAPKQAQLVTLLDARGWTDLPTTSPPPPFVDGTDRLHDDGAHGDGAANNGVYANTFANTAKEGVYAFRFHITGDLGAGGRFHRVKTISRWVGVTVDAAASPITLTPYTAAPPGMQGVTVSIVPRDAKGEYLGPYRADEVTINASVGTFDGDVVGQIDGSYTRVLLFPEGKQPVITATAGGVTLTPTIGTREKCPRICVVLCRVWRWFCKLWK